MVFLLLDLSSEALEAQEYDSHLEREPRRLGLRAAAAAHPPTPYALLACLLKFRECPVSCLRLPRRAVSASSTAVEAKQMRCSVSSGAGQAARAGATDWRVLV
jgi:hypothetical protein